MDMKTTETTAKTRALFKGKAIYNPKGKAGEYAPWACNFYNGCSNDCEYCYCKRGVRSHVWDNKPHLKKCFKDENDALSIFEFELRKCLGHLRESSLFFTFSSDPFLPEVKSLYWTAAEEALKRGVRVQFLTKRADFVNDYFFMRNPGFKDDIAFGFTLTGRDDKEPGASSNQDRIKAMRILHERGFKTFASIEPIVSLDGSMRMIQDTLGFCDLYKIGLMSGVKKSYYAPDQVLEFVGKVNKLVEEDQNCARIYWKESVRLFLGDDLFLGQLPVCVGSDYDIFGRAKV